MKVEFRVPISPGAGFYSQVRLMALSLARLGPPYSEATIRVSVGDRPAESAVRAANGWSAGFPVEWRVVPAEVVERLPDPGWASGQDRYESPGEADVIVLCDADTCAVARFDDLLDLLSGPSPRAAGLQAHVSPFGARGNDDTWRLLLRSVGAPDTLLSRRYSVDVAGTHGLAPAYFNYGFVAFSAAGFSAVAPFVEPSLRLALDLLGENPFCAQVALSLALIPARVEAIGLGHELNCANDDLLTAHGLVALDAVRVIHYLRTNEFDRRDFLCGREKFDAFVGTRKSNAVSELLRQHVLGLPEAFVEWR